MSIKNRKINDLFQNFGLHLRRGIRYFSLPQKWIEIFYLRKKILYIKIYAIGHDVWPVQYTNNNEAVVMEKLEQRNLGNGKFIRVFIEPGTTYKDLVQRGLSKATASRAWKRGWYTIGYHDGSHLTKKFGHDRYEHEKVVVPKYAENLEKYLSIALPIAQKLARTWSDWPDVAVTPDDLVQELCLYMTRVRVPDDVRNIRNFWFRVFRLRLSRLYKSAMHRNRAITLS